MQHHVHICCVWPNLWTQIFEDEDLPFLQVVFCQPSARTQDLPSLLAWGRLQAQPLPGRVILAFASLQLLLQILNRILSGDVNLVKSTVPW